MNRLSAAGQTRVNRSFLIMRIVRASEETFRRLVFDALEGTGDICILGKQFCWYPVLPDPAPPPCRAPRLDRPVVCPGFGIDRFFV